uniref:FZ domain-containing protein n=1 Tax=Globisporangium ultimum (strain ATCC 200006 / CBS 805.95 / DAOM BR144) TaxID=431595 RepID=K3WK63_GLOUD
MWLLARGAQALECSSTCGTPSGLDFCSHVSFAVCPSESAYEELDAAALTAFNAWTNATTMQLAKLPQYEGKSEVELNKTIYDLDLMNASSSCGAFLKRLECAIHLPACEIGRDYTLLCQKSCHDNAKKKCPGLEHICTQFLPTEIESKSKCFKMDYSGPAVGMWVAGFTISLVFSILNSIGINLQKLSMTRNETAETKQGTFKQPLWVLGFALVCFGSLLDFVAFGMAPQTLLAPLAALSLVWNMFIAPIFHKEKVTKQNIIATVIIFFGVTLTVIFAGHSTPSYELEDLIHLYQQPVMYAYIFLIVLFIGGLFYFSRYIERTHNYEGGLYHIICYGGIAGTFGGQSVLLAKSTVELLKSAIWGQAGAYMFTQLASYLIICGMGMCLGCQVHFLNGGLARFDALVVVPVYQSFWILTSVLGGIMYFEEYVNMTRAQMFMFTVGGIVTILGIVVLLKTRTEDGGSETGRYVELSLTPSSAWNADDSDEEEIQLKLAHNDEREEHFTNGGSTAKVVPSSKSISSSSPSATMSSSSASSVSGKGKQVSDSGISNAIYRKSSTTTSPKAASNGGRGKSKDDEEEDDFI